MRRSLLPVRADVDGGTANPPFFWGGVEVDEGMVWNYSCSRYIVDTVSAVTVIVTVTLQVVGRIYIYIYNLLYTDSHMGA